VLPFADCSFDACRAERVLLHVAEPRQAIQEMLRVSKPGARLVFSEPDWGSAILDSPDWRLTETILRFYCETLACGRIGRMLPGLLMDEGLTDVTTIPSAFLTLKNPNLEGGPLAESAECAVRSGIVSAESRDRWLADLRETDARGRFFFSITCFTVRAIRPLSIH